MREKFDITPSSASTASPDQSMWITLEEKHYNATFAVLLASSIGYFEPLLARLRAYPDVELAPDELKFVVDNWGKRQAGGNRAVEMHRNRLRIAAHYLEFDRGDPGEGKKMEAQNFAAEKCGVNDLSDVRRAVRFAKTVHYGPWRWWDIAARLARKNKLEQLHRTY